MPDPTIDALRPRPRRLRVLEASARTIEDEWSYVTDLERRLADTPRRRRRGARRRGRDAGDGAPRSTGPSTRSAGSSDPHRAIDWLSTFPQVVLLAIGERPDEVPGRRPRRAGRGLRGDPGRPAGRRGTPALLADATPAQRVLARAVMNGETTDPDGWRAMFPSLFGDGRRSGGARPVRGDPGGLARGRRPRRAGPQPGPRRDRRGADRAAPAGAPGRGRRGPPRAADPVRRRGRGDPPLRRHGRARRRGRGLRLQVGRAGHQRRRPAPARRRADPRRRRGRAARGRAGRLRRRAARARSGSTARPRRPRAPRLVAIETLDELAGPAAMTIGRPDDEGYGAPLSRALRRGGARRAAPDVGPAPLRAGSRVDPLGGARLRP